MFFPGIWLTTVLYIYALPIIIYLAFSVPALFYLRKRELDETSRAVWALAIIAVPIMGAVAFTAMQPGERLR